MPKIVLLAPNGQVGFEVARAVAPIGQLSTLSRADVDFADTKSVISKVLALQPDVIINAAAYTAVDQAESEPDKAYALNATLPEMLARLAEELGAWLVHYSTDYVYPGDGERPWSETDETKPLSVYGLSKLAGDEAIQAYCKKHLIFRTSWVYAARGHNFMRTMLKLAQQRQSLQVVNDQIGAPTPARYIAAVTALALQQITAGDKHCAGIYHVSTSGATSWHGFAHEIFRQARQLGMPMALQQEQCVAISSADYPTAARRPANSRLSLRKIEQQFQLQLPDWQSQLALTLQEWSCYQDWFGCQGSQPVIRTLTTDSNTIKE